MAAHGPHSLGAGAHAMLPYLTVGGFLMLGWLATTFFTRNRGRGARRGAQLEAEARYDRGRTIYRNTPMADVDFNTRGIP
jgi:hypothetical protein